MRTFKTQLSMGSRVRNAALSAICSMTLAAGLVPALAIAEQPNFEVSDLSAMAYDEASDYSVIWTYAADYDYQHVAPGSQFTVELAASTSGAALSCCQVEIAYDATKVSLGTDSIVMSKALEEAEAYDRGDGTAIITFYGNTMNAVNMASLTFTAAAEAAGDPAIVITNVICGASGDLNDANVNYTQGNAAVIIDASAKTPAEKFVERLYSAIYERPGEPEGIEFWAHEVTDGSGPAAVVKTFYETPEFASKGYTPEEQVTRIYQGVFGRDTDPDGLSYWAGEIAAGHITASDLAASLTSTEEFRLRCIDWGLDV